MFRIFGYLSFISITVLWVNSLALSPSVVVMKISKNSKHLLVSYIYFYGILVIQ